MRNGLARAEGIPGLELPSYRETRGLADALDTVLARARRCASRARAGGRQTAAEPAESERLRNAFDAFSEAATSLEASYAMLRSQVEQLSAQLARANGELERQLQEKQALVERQTALLAALPAGVVVIDDRGTVHEANAAAGKLLGMSVVGRAWTETAARLQPTDCEFEWLTPGEVQRRIGMEQQCMDATGGRIVLLHDVTEAHAARERQQRNERLASMGEMAARLAHQLRTPLATAMLYANQLERSGISASERATLGQRILSRLRGLERVTRDMLRFVRGEHTAGQTVAVSTLLAEAVQVMEPLMGGRGIAFVCEDNSSGAILQGDRRGLAAALLSLLENAAQATPQGGKVRIEAMTNSLRIRIRVSDTGSGIPAQALPRLFEPFYSTRADGTGLGLAIVRSVVDAHGGSVEVESSETAGTCFTLTLPREQPLALPQPAAQSAQSAQSAPLAVRALPADLLAREAA